MEGVNAPVREAGREGTRLDVPSLKLDGGSFVPDTLGLDIVP